VAASPWARWRKASPPCSRKGDTFLIGGEIVRYEGMREMVVEVTRTPWQKPKIATFMGTKFATSTQLATAS
jgi:ATP-dependent Lhr-like helicase